MTISPSIRLLVQRRANHSCEYCGVSEVDTGGELTIDHFQPLSHGGTDDIANLIYCCIRCNQYKRDYWPRPGNNVVLWNPRLESSDQHILLIESGLVEPLTAKGAFTIQLLRLNRPRLVEHRHKKQQDRIRARLLDQVYGLVQSYEHLAAQQTKTIEEQHRLLDEQANLLRRLLD